MSPVSFSPPRNPVAYEEDDFITVSDLGNLIGRDLSSDDAAAVAVDAATDYCRTFAEQTFTQVKGDTVILDGTGTDALLLPQLPVLKVTSVKDYGTAVTDWVLNDNGVLFRQTSTDASVTCIPPSIWQTGRQRFTVVYDHGYDTIPGDVKAVALAIAARLIIQGPALYETRGQDSIRYAAESTAVMPTERLILRKYRTAR